MSGLLTCEPVVHNSSKVPKLRQELKNTLSEGFCSFQGRKSDGFFGLSNKKTLFSLAFLRVMPLIDAASGRFRSSTEMRSGLFAAQNFSRTGGTNDNGEKDWK